MAHLGSLNITEKMKQLLKVIERVHGNHIGIPKQYKMFHKKKHVSQRIKKLAGTADKHK